MIAELGLGAGGSLRYGAAQDSEDQGVARFGLLEELPQPALIASERGL
jgi:hypothetical protein